MRDGGTEIDIYTATKDRLVIHADHNQLDDPLPFISLHTVVMVKGCLTGLHWYMLVSIPFDQSIQYHLFINSYFIVVLWQARDNTYTDNTYTEIIHTQRYTEIIHTQR